MTIQSIAIYRLSIPMVPFTIASGTMQFAQNIFIRVFTDEGITGVGECSAFPMITGETQDTCLVLAKDFAKIWKGKDALDIGSRMAELHQYVSGNFTVKSAFDMALYDIVAKSRNMPLYRFLGGSYAEPESDLTIGIGAPEKMAEQALEFVTEKKARILKVKLGKDPETDVRRMIMIRKAVGKNTVLRVDANQGWDFEGAVFALTNMEHLDIEFCEQPISKRLDEKMSSLKRISHIKIMADESVFDHYDAERLIKTHSCDYINIKLSKAGGIKESLRIHEVCKNAGIFNMMGGMLESRLALSAKVHFALACSNIRFYDMDTCLLGHTADPVINGVQFSGMKLQLPDLPGIGADMDEAFLQHCEQFTV